MLKGINLLCLLGLLFTCATQYVYAQQVSFDLAKFAAVDYANTYYDGGDYVSYITYYDFDNNHNIYAFIFRKSDAPEKNITQIKTDVEANYTTYQKLKEELKSLQSSGTDNTEISKKKGERKVSYHQLRGRDYYTTILVSTTKEQSPIIHSYPGLPHSLYQRPLVADKIVNKAKFNGLNLWDRVYFVSKIEQYYTFIPSQLQSVTPADSEISIVRIGSYTLQQKPAAISPSSKVSRIVAKKALTTSGMTKEQEEWEVMRILKEQMGR